LAVGFTVISETTMTVSLWPVRTPRRRRRKRLLHDALQPSRRERLLGNAMLSFRAGVWLTLIDPEPSLVAIGTGHSTIRRYRLLSVPLHFRSRLVRAEGNAHGPRRLNGFGKCSPKRLSTTFPSRLPIATRGSFANSDNTGRQAPHGGELSSASITTANSTMSRAVRKTIKDCAEDG
jgi:hypothetical protein